MRRRFLNVAAVILMLMTIFQTGVGAVSFKDMPSDWSRDALDNALDKGLLNGFEDGTIRPNANLTRAQMAAVVNRSFNSKGQTSLDNYSDIKKTDWFYDEMARAVSVGIFTGHDQKLNPNADISREEAFVVLSRALNLDKSTLKPEGFKDLEDVSPWARGKVFSLVDNNYIQGSDGRLNPRGKITRAEFAQVMDNILNYREPEDSEELVEEKVLEINQEVLEDNREVIVEQEVQEEQEVLEDKEEILEEEVPAGLEIELEVLRLVNIERKKQGIKPLKLGEDLIKVAKLKSEDMADNEYFSHTSPTYGSPFDMMKRSNIIYKIAGENIAMGHTSPEDVMDGWMNSPSHKASILDPRFGTLGVGYVSGNGTRYWTQMFTD